MADKQTFVLTDEQLSKIITAAVTAAKAPNPVEAKEIEKQIEADKRRSLMQVEMAKAEEENTKRKKYGCTHSRYPMSMGKQGGHAAPKGTGEWTTGGQLCGRNPKTGTPRAVLICQRCSWTWTFEPTIQELDFINESGMMGMTPPTKERYGDRLIAE